MTKAFLLLAFLAAFFTACPAVQAASDANPVFTARLSGEISRIKYETDGTIRLSLLSPEGSHRLILQRRAAFEAVQSAAGQAPPLLFQGLRLGAAPRHFNRRVAASLIGSDFSVVFYGKRRGRLFEAHFDIDAATRPLPGRLQHYSRFMRIGCATSAGQAHDRFAGAQAFEALPAFSPQRYLEVSTDADYEYYRVYKAQTAANIQSILNTAEAIYTSQLGIRFDLVRQHAFQNRKPQPLTSSDALTLLNQFRDVRSHRNHLGQADVYQLFTGKDLFGSIIGLSYVGPVCQDNFYSVSLVMRVANSIQALVSAHEFGHTLGASHPEDTLPSPPASLMTGIVRPDQTSFSNFSLNEINSHLAQWDPAAQCLSETRRLRVGLSVHLKSAEQATRLSVRSDLNPAGGANGCQLLLYGSARSSRLGLSSTPSSGATRLFQTTISGSPLLLRGSASRGSSRTVRIAYFRAYVQCPDSRFAYSPLRRASLRAYGRSASLSPFFKAAASSLRIN